MYELLYIIPANFTEKELEPIKDKVKKIIKDLGGEITLEENLGLKRLAYSIRQVSRGYYILLNFNMEKDNLAKLERNLKLTSEVLRHQVIKIKVGVKKEKKRRYKKSAIAETQKETKTQEETKTQKVPPKKVDLEELEERLDKILET